MKCSYCGTEYEGNFCPECGAKAETQSSTTPPPIQQPTSQQQRTVPPVERNVTAYQKPKKPKKLIYKKWWFYVVAAVALIAIIGAVSGGSKSVKINWNEMILGSQLPEPPTSKGKINENSSDELRIEIINITDKQYNDYVEACKSKGFTVDAESKSSTYAAYNAEGYKLSVSHYDSKGKLSIKLEKPMEMSTITWPAGEAGSQLPVPKSTIGKFSFEHDDSFYVYIGNTSRDDYNDYVKACSDKGFTVDYSKGDTYYYADNSDGWSISLKYEGNNIMSISIDALGVKKQNRTTDSTATGSDSKTQKNGFDSSTNGVYTLAGYTVEIPKYWKSESKIDGGFQRYAETGGKVAMLQISAQAETDDNYPVTFDGLMDDNDNMIAAIESTVFKEVTDYEIVDTGIIKGILYKGTIVDKESGLSGYGEWFAFASEEDRTWCTLIFCQTDNSEYNYTDDFMKMIKSIKPVENIPPETTTTLPITNEITLTMGKDDFKGMNYQEAEKKFREMGFTAFKYETVDTKTESAADTICYIEITEWLFGKSNFEKGDKFDADATVTFYTYKYTAPSPVSYSTNDLETAKKGNSGVFSYKSRGGSYDIYWIIDFDEGYVYWFTDGNGDSTCDRVAIVSGTLNDAVTITYHDGDSTWSNRLFFKWQNQPDHLVMQDHNGFTYDYYSTNLSSALSLRNARTIYDY